MANKQKILFRADASAEIGYGHFVRTLALADMLKDDFECVFYTQTPSEYQRKECEKVCKLVELPADETRFQLFYDGLQGDEIVVLDNYFYTTDYQKSIKEKGCKLVCIDDMHDKHYVADAIVNHGMVEPSQFDCEYYTRLCLGKEWSLLRKPFLVPIKQKKREHQIVICFGGADPYRLTDKVVSLLLELRVSYRIVVVLGDKAQLNENNRENALILKKLSAQQMADLFESSEIGIMPSSSVKREAVSRGLKVITGYFVDNQQVGFERSLLMKDVIPVYNFGELTRERLSMALNDIEKFTFEVPDYSKVPVHFINLMQSL